jgi:dolichyl-phosphate-mannose-protein mannosyltransferase
MADESRQSSAGSRELLLLKALLLLVGIACLAIRLETSYVRAASPFQADYEEGNILNAASRIVHGLTPYPAPGSFPYTVNCYGPIGYLLSALGIKIFGLSLFGPRLLVLLAGIGIVFLIAAIVKTLGNRWDVGFFAAVSFLCVPLVYAWLPTLRVDFWAIFLSLLGLYIFTKFPRAWSLAGLVFGFALLTKHTAVAAPAAVFLELLAQKKLKRGFLLAGITCGTVLLCMVSLGRDFVFALLITHPDPYSLTFALHSSALAVYGCIPLFAVIICALPGGFRWTERYRLAWFYVAMCTLALLSAGKLGSSANHFLEWTAAVCILCGIALSYLFDTNDVLAYSFAAGLLAVSIIFIGMSQQWRNKTADRNKCAEAFEFVRTFKGDRILSENVSALVLAGKTVLVSNPFVVTQLGNSVKWQAGSMEELAQARYFDLILLGGELKDIRPESGRWSPELIKVIELRYSPVRSFQCLDAKVAYIPSFAHELQSGTDLAGANNAD